MRFGIDLFGMQKRRLRRLDTAILLAGNVRDSLRKQPPSDSDAFMVAVQIRALFELLDADLRRELGKEGSPFHLALDRAKWETPSSDQPSSDQPRIDGQALARALDGLKNLLETQRMPHAPQPGGEPDPQPEDDLIKRQGELDTAVLLAGNLRDSLRNQPSASDADAFITAVQIRALFKLLDADLQRELSNEGSPFHLALDRAKWETPSSDPPSSDRPRIDGQALARALDGLKNLLESRHPPRAPQSDGSPAPQPETDAIKKRAENEKGKPDDATVPDDTSVLWRVTDKLYSSGAVRLLFAAIAVAIVTAVGGSIVIGGQTFNVRQSLDKTLESLDNAQEKARTEMRSASADAQNRVSADAANLLASLREKGQEINSKLEKAEREVTDLKTGSDSIKANIIAKLQEGLKAEQSSLREAIMNPLENIRDRDVSKLSTTVSNLDQALTTINTGVTRHKERLAELGSKLGELQKYADQSDKIGTALRTIATDMESAHKSRMTAEAEASTAVVKRAAAEAFATEAEQHRKRAGDSVKGASDEAIKHNRTLALIENQLKSLDERLKVTDAKLRDLNTRQADIDTKQKSADTKQKTSDSKQVEADARLYALDGLILQAEEHLAAVKKRIAVLESSLPKPPPSAEPSAEDRMQIQRALTNAGFPVGKIDGNFGTRTTNAIKAYQTKARVEATGKLAREQIDALLKDAGKRP